MPNQRTPEVKVLSLSEDEMVFELLGDEAMS